MKSVNDIYYLNLNLVTITDTSSKSLQFHPVSGLQKPEITPLNQSARIGSNVAFLCTVGGHPRPVISWSRTANNSDTFNESNSRIRIKTNVKRGQSHLIIAEITEYDYGIYFCSAKNILGEQVSNPAVLWQTTGES